MIESVLQQIGLNQKEIDIYLACLKLGPSPVRKIAQSAGVNRGTAYDILKSLQQQGLVSYYHRDTHQYFMAEDPEKLTGLVEQRVDQLEATKRDITSIIPQLKSMYDNAGEKPLVKYYEGLRGIKTILQDVLDVCSQGNQEYAVYSSSSIKQFLYEAYEHFSQARIKAGIKVKTISIGPGGETVGLDERKWLTKKESSPTYTLIYNNKVAMVSVNSDQKPIGVMVEDKNIFLTQKMIFEFIWQQL